MKGRQAFKSDKIKYVWEASVWMRFLELNKTNRESERTKKTTRRLWKSDQDKKKIGVRFMNSFFKSWSECDVSSGAFDRWFSRTKTLDNAAHVYNDKRENTVVRRVIIQLPCNLYSHWMQTAKVSNWILKSYVVLFINENKTMWTKRLSKLSICGLFETLYITTKTSFMIYTEFFFNLQLWYLSKIWSEK